MSSELNFCSRKKSPNGVTAQENSFISWENKEDKAFFRGRDSNRERLDLVRISKANPELLDAGITHYFFFKKGEEEELGKVDRVGFYKFFQVKTNSYSHKRYL